MKCLFVTLMWNARAEMPVPGDIFAVCCQSYTIATWVLSYTEKGAPLFSLLFEVVSALSTVGLSIDYTPPMSLFQFGMPIKV